MMRIIAVLSAVMAAAVLEACFLYALPWPFSALRVTVMIVVGLIAGFRFGEGLAAAVLGGAILDMLSPEPAGSHLVAMVVMAVLLNVLFTRVLTNVSWPSFIGINAAAFLIFRALFAVIRITQDFFTASSVLTWPTAGDLTAFMAAMLLQVVMAALFQVAVRRVHIALRSSFFFAR